MTLELNKVTGQIEEMGQVLVARTEQRRRALPAARELLQRYASAQEALRELAESESGRRLRCASPGDERLDATWPAPRMPERITFVAADGSQIYPNHHGMAFYYVLNVGSMIFRHGSGQAPEVATSPRLFYHDHEVYPGGEPINSDLVSAERDLAEMRRLADLALAEPADGPVRLALADGPLLLWPRSTLPPGRDAQILDDYLACLERLGTSGALLSGFVSRPYSSEVVALLYLAGQEPEERLKINSLAETDFRGLTDRALFGALRPGERSALFLRGTGTNQDFRARGQGIYFFYLNTGADLARVEVPVWVVRQGEHLNLVHAAVYEQCRFNNGYPYVLTRADEQAVILGPERETLEAMISQAMARHGLPLPELSRKAQQKQVARWRKRR